MNEATLETEIARFLATGESDAAFRNWPGAHARHRIQAGDRAMREERRALVASIESVPDERVDVEELRDLLERAVRARNGWRVILKYCSGQPLDGKQTS